MLQQVGDAHAGHCTTAPANHVDPVDGHSFPELQILNQVDRAQHILVPTLPADHAPEFGRHLGTAGVADRMIGKGWSLDRLAQR
jgi:hypothetical protein